MLLGELLKARGIKFDVLSRGYGRKSRGVRLVDPAGLPQEFGDEPLLMARKLGAPVIVGEYRYEAGRFAESKFGPQLHLLADSCGTIARAFVCVAACGCGGAGEWRVGGGVSGGGKAGMAGAARDCAGTYSAAAGGVLRHRPAAEFCASVAGGKH